MANSPLKNKNALGNNMAQDNKSKGTANAAGGSMFGQGYVPGGKQAPYWQTQDMGAVVPQGKPAWMAQEMKQQAISGGAGAGGSTGDDYYAEGGAADQAIAGSTTGETSTGGIQSPEGNWKYDRMLEAAQQAIANGASIEDLQAAGYPDVVLQNLGTSTAPQGYQQGDPNPYMGQLQELYDQILGTQGTNWDQQKNSAIAQMQAQAGQQRLALQNAMAAAGGTSSSGASGAYMGGMGQLGFQQQSALGSTLAELERNRAAEELAKYQQLAQLGAQMGDMYGQNQMVEQSRKQAWVDNMMNLANETFADLSGMNMVLGQDQYAEEYFYDKMGMSYADYKAMMQQAFKA